MEGQHPSVGHELLIDTSVAVARVVAVVVGLILMFVGIGMGVALVLLPGAIPVGFLGLFVFLWGLFGSSGGKRQGG